jgi:hypothetical protein
MKCPHCYYVDGYEPSTATSVDGEEGSFFIHPVQMERQDIGYTKHVDLVGCPCCKKTFID